MADPVAVITYTDTPIAATSLPTSAVMSGATSTPGDGTSIAGYQWHLLQKPPGSAANLVDATSSICTLDDIDLPGTYYVFLVVTNDLGHTSFNQPTPKQLGVAPYTFTAPPASSLRTVTVLTANAGLIKVAPGERDWLARGLWPLVEEVDALRGEHDDLQTDFDNHTIADHDTTATGAQLNTMTGGASSDASSLHTHTSIPATTIGTLEVTTGLDVDNVYERTADTGVTIDGVLLKDGTVGGVAITHLVRLLHVEYVDEVTTGTSIQTLWSAVIPGGILSTGDVLQVQFVAVLNEPASDQDVVVSFTQGSSQTVSLIANYALAATAAVPLSAELASTGPGTQRISGSLRDPTTLLPTQVAPPVAATFDLSNNITLALRVGSPNGAGEAGIQGVVKVVKNRGVTGILL